MSPLPKAAKRAGTEHKKLTTIVGEDRVSHQRLEHLLTAYCTEGTDAQQEFLEAVQPLILKYVQQAMGAKLRTLEESVDISQSLLLGIHMRMASGEMRLENEGALKAYLRAMVRNKLAKRASAMNAIKRGGGSQPMSLDAAIDDEASLPLPTDDLTASVVARVKETKERIDGEMSEEERFILEGRLMGRTDREIGEDLGKTPDAVRMIWSRSRKRLVGRGILRDG